MAGTLTGGLRDRMVLESIFRDVQAKLQALGWFDSNRQHQDITMVDEYPDTAVEVPINTLAVSYGSSFQSRLEMGSRSEVWRQIVYVDFFAESDALGRHLIGDIYAHVNEQMGFSVWNYSIATPVIDFYIEVMDESVETDRPTNVTNPWEKHWYMLAFTIEDQRSNA